MFERPGNIFPLELKLAPQMGIMTEWWSLTDLKEEGDAETGLTSKSEILQCFPGETTHPSSGRRSEKMNSN